jgi:uncharacterized protein YdcH (DUF465 family)
MKSWSRIETLDTFEFNVQNSQIFEKIFHLNSLSEQISEAEESDRYLSTANDVDEEIHNFDAFNSGFSGLEIRFFRKESIQK